MSCFYVLQVLAADVNIGYEEMVNTRVQKVNGKQVKNLMALVQIIGGCTEDFLRLDLEYNQVFWRVTVSHTAHVTSVVAGLILNCDNRMLCYRSNDT